MRTESARTADDPAFLLGQRERFSNLARIAALRALRLRPRHLRLSRPVGGGVRRRRGPQVERGRSLLERRLRRRRRRTPDADEVADRALSSLIGRHLGLGTRDDHPPAQCARGRSLDPGRRAAGAAAVRKCRRPVRGRSHGILLHADRLPARRQGRHAARPLPDALVLVPRRSEGGGRRCRCRRGSACARELSAAGGCSARSLAGGNAREQILRLARLDRADRFVFAIRNPDGVAGFARSAGSSSACIAFAAWICINWSPFLPSTWAYAKSYTSGLQTIHGSLFFMGHIFHNLVEYGWNGTPPWFYAVFTAVKLTPLTFLAALFGFALALVFRTSSGSPRTSCSFPGWRSGSSSTRSRAPSGAASSCRCCPRSSSSRGTPRAGSRPRSTSPNKLASKPSVGQRKPSLQYRGASRWRCWRSAARRRRPIATRRTTGSTSRRSAAERRGCSGTSRTAITSTPASARRCSTWPRTPSRVPSSPPRSTGRRGSTPTGRAARDLKQTLVRRGRTCRSAKICYVVRAGGPLVLPERGRGAEPRQADPLARRERSKAARWSRSTVLLRRASRRSRTKNPLRRGAGVRKPTNQRRRGEASWASCRSRSWWREPARRRRRARPSRSTTRAG